MKVSDSPLNEQINHAQQNDQLNKFYNCIINRYILGGRHVFQKLMTNGDHGSKLCKLASGRHRK